MTLDRRSFFKIAGLAAGASLASCSPAYRWLGDRIDGASGWIEGDTHAFRVLRRLTYGPTLSERVLADAVGIEGWVEEQLSPQGIRDAAADLAVRPLTSLTLDAADLAAWERADVDLELKQGALLRRLHSRRQLQELLVEFWTDHFNISIEKGDCWYLKPVDDRDVIRRHALGNFRQLLQASAHSPAMLVYLDNQANDRRAPNENYARELLELHTLGVDGGYTQRDVMEMARCLTGWTVKDRFWKGEFVFRPELHDEGTKTVLKTTVAPSGEREASAVIDELATNPKTARRIARKLARRFLDPEKDVTESLVETAAQAYLRSGGEILPMLRTILFQGVLANGDRLTPLFKRPVDFVTSALRQTNAATNAGRPLQAALSAMGQPLFEWPTPDGPPEDMATWQGGLFARWDFAFDLAAGAVEGTACRLSELLAARPAGGAGARLAGTSNLLLGATLDRPSAEAIQRAAPDDDSGQALILAGLLASPHFQWR